jgi:hypothetical protein
MKLESLVIANQHVAVNFNLDLVHTARHARTLIFKWNIINFLELLYFVIYFFIKILKYNFWTFNVVV